MSKEYKMTIDYKGKQKNTNNWLPMSDEEFIDLRNQFYEKPSLQDVKNEILSIMKNGSTQQAIIRRYFFRDLQAKVLLYHNNWTVEDAFKHKPILEVFNEKITKNDNVFLPGESKLDKLLKSMKLGGSGFCGLPGSFKIGDTQNILKKYSINNNYYDSSCGWGGRMIGSITTGNNYYGTDPNYELTSRLKQLATMFQEIDLFSPNVNIYTQGSEIFIPELENKIGVSFTSPPYFFLEDYGIGEQSTTLYPRYEDWVENFLLKTFKNIYRYLIDGGHLLWNIKDYQEFDLVNKSIEKAKQAGFIYIGAESGIVNNLRPKSNNEMADTSEDIYIFRKGENIHNVDYNINLDIHLDIDDDDIEVKIEEKEMNKNLFSTEQVSKYHPDKYADQISDSIVYYAINKNKNAKCAIETLVKNDTVIVAGEINGVYIDDNIVEKLVKNVANHLNYNVSKIINLIDKQSPEINKAVDVNERIMAGDQGMVYGYACNETKSYLPFGLDLANKIIERIENKVNEGILKGDAKTQVTVDLNTNEIEKVLVSVCHNGTLENVKSYIKEILSDLVPNEKLLINPAGSWQTGGPTADAGLTGRKIVADQYGGYCAVGGGAFSGKDLSKVDRSGAYTARNIAIDIVDKYKVNWCEIQIGYAIGIENPMSVFVKTSNKELDNEIQEFVIATYDLTPTGMINTLNLMPRDYIRLSQGNHYRFGKVTNDIT